MNKEEDNITFWDIVFGAVIWLIVIPVDVVLVLALCYFICMVIFYFIS